MGHVSKRMIRVSVPDHRPPSAPPRCRRGAGTGVISRPSDRCRRRGEEIDVGNASEVPALAQDRDQLVRCR